MTGPEHYVLAEKLLTEVGQARGDVGRDQRIAIAQVHATLALTAANALAAVIPLAPRETYPAEVRAWRDATRVPDGPPRS